MSPPRHYVLTRSAYGPDWTLEANRRRLAITRAVTVRLMATQTWRDWTWIVLLDERDELLAQRLQVFLEAGVEVKPLLWVPGRLAAAPWDRRPDSIRSNRLEQVAATAYRAPWRSAIRRLRHPLLTTRLDDDDGLAPTTLDRVQRAARRVHRRTALVHPWGYRTWAGRCSLVRHDTNAMHSLMAPPTDEMLVYDYGHRRVRTVAPVVEVDQHPAWLWVRHQDTISGWKVADDPITPDVRALFPIDWTALE